MLHTRLIAMVVRQLRGDVAHVDTERWTDTPQYANAPIFVAKPLQLTGQAGDTIELRLGVPEAKRPLPRAHQAFFNQRNADQLAAPPPPLPDLFLELVKRRNSQDDD